MHHVPWVRFEYVHRARLGLSPDDCQILAEVQPPANPGSSGGAFASAWRNYIKAILKRGYWYNFSCWPSVFFYVSENKTLAGKEVRHDEGEAVGRKLAIVFFECLQPSVVHRVNNEGLAMHPQLLTIAELVQTCGMALAADPERTSAQTELLLEAAYQTLNLRRFTGILEAGADEVHTYSLTDEDSADAAYAAELEPPQRTKMVLARCLERNGVLADGETLQSAWAQPSVSLQERAAARFIAAPPAPPPFAAPPAAAARGRGRGRGPARGRVARGGARG